LAQPGGQEGEEGQAGGPQRAGGSQQAPAGQQLSYAGVVVSLESLTELTAIVYAPQTALLRYGALALVEEPAAGRSYLALVVDVSEKSIIPAVDQQQLRQLTQAISQASTLQSLRNVLELLFSPTNSLIRWHGVRMVRLRVLGEIVGSTLSQPSSPPRPTALVREPDPGLLQQIVGGGLAGGAGLYLGRLAYNPQVSVYLDPHRLTMHMAVLGQTGSGKTETVKRLVAEYAARKHMFSSGGGVVVFDVAGEYTGYPYDPRPRAYPLLDMALNPQAYGYQNAQWLSTARKTILVPYDLASIGFKMASEWQYVKRVAAFVRELNSRYQLAPTGFRGLVYGRHSIYEIDPNGSFHPVDRARAAQLIASEPLLVVAAPLPSSLTVEEVVELSHTTSPAFPDLVESAADILGLLEVSTVNEVKGLADLIAAAARLASALKSTSKSKGQEYASLTSVVEAVRAAARAYRAAVERGERSPERRACSELGRKLRQAGFVDCWSLASLAAYMAAAAAADILSAPEAQKMDPSLVEKLERIESYHPRPPHTQPNPELNPWDVLAEAEEADSQLGGELSIWGSLTSRAATLAALLSGEQWNTVRSLVRGLRRVARHLTAHLDAQQYRLLVERRLLEGFTIVQLAPPSLGDTDHAVARLIEELFESSVANYQPDRRTLIAVEEAHNLAPANVERASKTLLLRVAREGRKWGLSLLLVSQRPGFIDPNILSQAATVALLRIVNPDDIAGLRKGAESVSQELVDRLPDLEQGQAVVAGLAVPERRIPLLVAVEMLRPAQQPQPTRMVS
jgi:hypothetical protein